MTLNSSAAQLAAGTFQEISEGAEGERARRASAGALVLRAFEQSLAEAPGGRFVAMRAATEVAALAGGAERTLLQRLLVLLPKEGEPDVAEEELASGLVGYACELEKTRRLPEADAALALAREVAAGDAEIALHAGRVARKLADRERALTLYRAARELDRGDGAIARLAAIGEAVVADVPERALGAAIRQARRAGDAEAAGVGLEERARVRRAAGDRRGAARDLCAAALRYPDPVDAARVAHELADVLLAAGDPAAAREALMAALAVGNGAQRDHARSRLHTLSRALGDQLGMRRWRAFSRPALVSLSARRASSQASTAAPRLAQWRESLTVAAPVAICG